MTTWTTIPFLSGTVDVDAAQLAAARAMDANALRTMLINAKGKRDFRAEAVAVFVASERSDAARDARNHANRHAATSTASRGGSAKARAYDSLHNEGGEGFNPHRCGR